MCLCVHVQRVHLCMYVCNYVVVCTCAEPRIGCMYVCAFMCSVFVYMHVCIYVCMYAFIWLYVHVQNQGQDVYVSVHGGAAYSCMYVCMHSYRCMYVHIM